MPYLPTLVDDFAARDPRGHPTVEIIARKIREAGLLTTSKRGRGAVEMTARDAATLLIGLCCSQGPKVAPDTTRKFCSLIRDPAPLSDEEDEYPESLLKVFRSKTLLDCFELFILRPEIIINYDISVNISVTYVRAAIGITWEKDSKITKFRHRYVNGALKRGQSVFDFDEGPDFFFEAGFNTNVFYRLHKILKSD